MMAKSDSLKASASQHAAALVREIKRQSQPRRWPWQERTIRDLIDEGRSDLAEVALARTAALSAAAAQQREQLLNELQRQSQPRRWPWQEKTTYDRVADQRARLANAAVERAAALTDSVTTRRDYLLATGRRQPRRRAWHEATFRNKIQDQQPSFALQGLPQIWRKPEPTLLDKLEARSDDIKTAIAETLPVVQQTVDMTAERVRKGAQQTADRVQQTVSAAPQRLSVAATSAADTLKDTTQQVAHRVGETAGSAADSVKTAAMLPVDVVRDSVEASQQAVTRQVAAGKRSVRRGVRLVRAILWGLLIGAAIGVLLAPRSGSETRRNLEDLWKRILDLVAPTN